MRSVVLLLIFFSVSSFGELDFKARNFSVELLYHAVQDLDGNVIISPYVLWSLLMSLAYETAGVTREQIFKVLSLTEDRSEAVQQFQKLNTSLLVDKGVTSIALVNYLFYDQKFTVYSDSIRRLETDFGFVTRRLNFEGPFAANDASETFNLYIKPSLSIETLIIRSEDFIDTMMIMGNSVEFTANWLNQLYLTQVVRKPGYASLFHMKARLRFSNFQSLHASVTELPYEGDLYCMLLIRPHRGYDMKQVFRNVKEVSLNDILAKLQSDAAESGLREVEVTLPDYFYTRLMLNEPVYKMGLTGAFDNKSVIFNNFAEDNIYMGEITHRVDIYFDKFKTKVYSFIPAVLPELKFKTGLEVDDPFIFFIIEKPTATVLYGGSFSFLE